MGVAELAVVARAAAGEAVHPRGRERELLDELLGVARERVDEDERRAVAVGGGVDAGESAHQLARRVAAVGGDVAGEAGAELHVGAMSAMAELIPVPDASEVNSPADEQPTISRAPQRSSSAVSSAS